MARVSPGAYKASEQDWPIVLGLTISSRPQARTQARMTFCATGPGTGPDNRFRAQMYDAGYLWTPEMHSQIANRLFEQIRRQIDLAANSKM